MAQFTLNVGNLSITDLMHLTYTKDATIKITEQDYTNIQAATDLVAETIKNGITAYGINTGFGLLANTIIPNDQLEELQRKIVLSHACGVGEYLPDQTVRLLLLLKINSLARGFSGIRPVTVDYLIALFNNQIYPCIPAKGSVGASGDLAPLAHMSMTLIGEGEARVNGQVMSAKEALAKIGLKPLTLIAKEGLALLNGTQTSTALALIGLFQALRNFSIAMLSGALSIDAAKGSIVPFDARINFLKNCPAQISYSKIMYDLLKDSELLESHADCTKVQDPYSLRCQPQVMGAVLTYLFSAADNLVNEANAVSDNPLVFTKEKEILSGGNFHAELVAISADLIAIAVSEIGAISERRISLLIDSHLSSLPPFLVNNPGVNSGFMLAHVTASALASENKTHAHPASIDSLPTSANQEDHVSMATFAARRLGGINENVLNILSIETLAACQGIDMRAPLKSSVQLERAKGLVREKVPFYAEDHYFAADINNARKVISATEYYMPILQQLLSVYSNKA
ncbi:MAG: histidine ammonia-lyase [Burkholderiales bacterium]|nr:histidine ammonia-lyase [Burkholderiales bacterium]